MRHHLVLSAMLLSSTILSGVPAFAQARPPGAPQPVGAQPGTIVGSGPSAQPVTGTTPATASTPVDNQTGAPTPSGAAASDATVGEVIVTAQRRETKLSRTPVAVSVLSSATLAKANIQTEQDLQLAVPGLTVRAGESSNQLNFALRGQTVDAFSFGRPGVLPYFDEVQVSNPTGSSSEFYDLQSIQVLKGPQGTLFGRNATGGAVLFTTTKPDYTFGGYASALGGDYDTYKAEGAVNLPIVDQHLALRLAGFYSTTGGYQTNTIDGTPRGDFDKYGIRASLRFDEGRFHNTLVVDYQYEHGTSLVSTLGNLDASQAGSFPTVALYNPATSDAVLGLVLQGEGVPAGAATAIATGNFGRYLASHPDADPAGISSEFARQQANGPFLVDSDVSDFFKTRNIELANTTTYDLGDNLQIKNIFGYIDIRGQQISNVDGTGYGITESIGKGIVNSAPSYSEELQVLGTAGPLKYVSGFYYSHEVASNQQDSLLFDIIPTGVLTGMPGVEGVNQQNNFTRINTTYAGYAQGTYDLSNLVFPGFSFTGGVRYTSENVEGITEPGDAGFALATTGLIGPGGAMLLPPSAFSNDQSHTYNNASWTLGLNEQLNPNLLIYLASRRSYKNGGFNGIIQPRIGTADAPVIPGDAYKVETVTDAELGTKFNGRVASMPTSADIAAYYDFDSDGQHTSFTSVNGSPSAITVNVPEARIYGVEMDGTIDPTHWLRLGGVFNYTHAKFTDNLVTVGTLTQPFGTYPDTPQLTGGPYADFTFAVNNNIDILFHGDVYGQTRSYYSATANINTGAVLHGYAVENFRVGLQDHYHGWSLTANVKNAFDRVYYVGGLPVAQLTEVNTILPGAPRTFTIEARTTF